jgi:hypothetical protein
VSGVVMELWKRVVGLAFPYIYMRNDPYTHFSQQPHNKQTLLVVFYYFFTKRKEKKTKKVIKYYQLHQLVVGLL